MKVPGHEDWIHALALTVEELFLNVFLCSIQKECTNPETNQFGFCCPWPSGAHDEQNSSTFSCSTIPGHPVPSRTECKEEFSRVHSVVVVAGVMAFEKEYLRVPLMVMFVLVPTIEKDYNR
ncbi:hypothetical protein DAPPUDRAFT_317975 [Daphnia pulex]|uniref:Uncharacterized protein n=1 Tax=Daphnia pulex TaxID=6669 RepID=E9GHH5_DAPPU|nr:hypothetical protein DAPPUDRAFT_317975 [Daphnia pulex]|eukprot:EFX80850.1 hypothetical protein DAPPUDRAFT_317975 [Daphnia pulex]